LSRIRWLIDRLREDIVHILGAPTNTAFVSQSIAPC